MTRTLPALLAFIIPCTVFGGEADVLDVTVTCDSNRVCDFSVTVRHDDAGWDHYANRWEILTADGDILGVRELLHPHDNEQPFTRTLAGVSIPAGLDAVLVRALDSLHGAGGKTMTVNIPND